MTEGSEHAAILIATSYQALNRAVGGNSENLLTDCTVLVLFAGFYVEATLNHIFEQSGKGTELRLFPLSTTNKNSKNYPGLKDKLSWFYNEFIDQVRATNWKDIYANGIKKKLSEKFPGFMELYKFRNDIAHGQINQSAKSLDNAKRLRQQAKEIVNQLYMITNENGYKVPRLVTYREAVATLENRETVFVSASSSS